MKTASKTKGETDTQTVLEVRDFRSCAGSEGDAFSCTLYLNGRQAATVRYAGRGGCYLFDFTISDSRRSGGAMYEKMYLASLGEDEVAALVRG